MTFWSGEKLAKIGKSINLVTPFEPDQIDCSSYTLTLGPECFVTPSFGNNEPNLKQQLDSVRTITVGGEQLPLTGGEMIIPAGQFAFLLTEEVIKIPSNAMGFISLKSHVKWKGLINVSGFHVDPGFQGRLIYSVYNAGPSNIHLARGERLFLLWIADLDQTSSEKYLYDKPPVGEISLSLISEVDRPLHSLQSLSETVEKLRNEISLLYRVLAALGVIAGLALAGWALFPSSTDANNKPAAIDGSQ